jgi:hypothetical protein
MNEEGGADMNGNSREASEARHLYWFVLTFIPDLMWCRVAPLVKKGKFGKNAGDCVGRDKWVLCMDEWEELDVSALRCRMCRSRAVRRTQDADDEEWAIHPGEAERVLGKSHMRIAIAEDRADPPPQQTMNEKTSTALGGKAEKGEKKGKAGKGKAENEASEAKEAAGGEGGGEDAEEEVVGRRSSRSSPRTGRGSKRSRGDEDKEEDTEEKEVKEDKGEKDGADENQEEGGGGGKRVMAKKEMGGACGCARNALRCGGVLSGSGVDLCGWSINTHLERTKIHLPNFHLRVYVFAGVTRPVT